MVIVPGGSCAYAAVIVPAGSIHQIEKAVAVMIAQSYRGNRPRELKYKRYSRRPRQLQQIGSGIVRLTNDIPGIAVLGLFVPRDGYFGEKLRGLKAFPQNASTSKRVCNVSVKE